MNATKTTLRISISVDGVWAGSGRIVNGRVEECGAVWCDDQDESDVVYEMLDDAIADGLESLKIEVAGKMQKFTWEITSA